MTTKPNLPILTWGFDNDGDQDGDTSHEWDCLTESLTELMKELSINTNWYCEVKNFGWMKQNGTATFKAATGQQLLEQVLPKTDNTFKIFIEGKSIRIQNWHHDSNDGSECYIIKAA